MSVGQNKALWCQRLSIQCSRPVLTHSDPFPLGTMQERQACHPTRLANLMPALALPCSGTTEAEEEGKDRTQHC